MSLQAQQGSPVEKGPWKGGSFKTFERGKIVS